MKRFNSRSVKLCVRFVWFFESRRPILPSPSVRTSTQAPIVDKLPHLKQKSYKL